MDIQHAISELQNTSSSACHNLFEKFPATQALEALHDAVSIIGNSFKGSRPAANSEPPAVSGTCMLQLATLQMRLMPLCISIFPSLCALLLCCQQLIASADVPDPDTSMSSWAAGFPPTQQHVPAITNNMQELDVANAVAQRFCLHSMQSQPLSATDCKGVHSFDRDNVCVSVAVTLHTHNHGVALELMPITDNTMPAAASLACCAAADKAVAVLAPTPAPACCLFQVTELDSPVQAGSKVSQTPGMQATAFMDTQRPPLLDTQVWENKVR